MYLPKHFVNTQEDEILSFMQKYSFATIVTAEENIPVATHLPFLIRKNNDQIVLSSHFAKANPQSDAILGKEILVVFTEPHAYISPKFYEKELNVPTWNYIAVHVYGKAAIIEDEAGKFDLLEKTIVNYEDDYLEQWNRLPADYKLKMIKGIVAFDIQVTNLQAKYKLSQNRTPVEQQNIINTFSGSAEYNEVQIAEYMKLNKRV